MTFVFSVYIIQTMIKRIFFVIFLMLLAYRADAAEQETPPLVYGTFKSDVLDKNLLVGSEIDVDFIVSSPHDHLKGLAIEIILPDGVRLVKGKLKKDFVSVKPKTKLKCSFRVRLIQPTVQIIKAQVHASESRYNTSFQEEYIFVLNQKFLEKPIYKK